MKFADKARSRYCIVIGDGELESSSCLMRSMTDGQETPCPLDPGAIANAIK